MELQIPKAKKATVKKEKVIKMAAITDDEIFIMQEIQQWELYRCQHIHDIHASAKADNSFAFITAQCQK